MEIRYSREMNHNYMIIEAPDGETGYEARMLSANAIEGLLKFRVHQTEERREYYYEITSRQPLKRVLEKRTLSGGELRSILLGILAVLGRVEEYLLKEEQLLLDPEYLYLEPDRFTVEICMVPGYQEETPQALSKLLGYLLERADHQDREAVVLAYNLYQISLRENYGTADLLRQISGRDRIFLTGEQKEESRMDLAEAWTDRKKYSGDGEFKREKEPTDENAARTAWNAGNGNLEYDMETIKKKTKLTDGVEKEDGRMDGYPEEKWMRRWIRILGSAVAAGMVYWYVTGEIDVILFAISGGAGVLMFVREVLAVRKKRRMHHGGKKSGEEKQKEIRKEVRNWEPEAHHRYGEVPEMETVPRRSGPQERAENRWQVYPESEEVCRQEIRREEEAQMERAKEAGTTLLSDSKCGKGTVCLDPMDADGEIIQIPYVPFTIGKHPELSDACIDRATVSRLHARIDQKEGVYILTDLNSTNGTSVNGYTLQANETVSLGNGDSVYLADVGYKFWENR